MRWQMCDYMFAYMYARACMLIRVRASANMCTHKCNCMCTQACVSLCAQKFWLYQPLVGMVEF